MYITDGCFNFLFQKIIVSIFICMCVCVDLYIISEGGIRQLTDIRDL